MNLDWMAVKIYIKIVKTSSLWLVTSLILIKHETDAITRLRNGSNPRGKMQPMNDPASDELDHQD